LKFWYIGFMMKKGFLLLTLVGMFGVLIAMIYVSGSSAPSPDLYATQLSAEQAQGEVEVALRSTQDARLAAEDARAQVAFDATIAAAETSSAVEAEISLLKAQGTATYSALALQVTATAEANHSRYASVLSTLDSAKAQATMRALEREQRRDEVNFQLHQTMNAVWNATFWFLATCIVSLFGYVFIRNLYLKGEKYSQSIYPDGSGKYPLLQKGGKVLDMGRSFSPVIDLESRDPVYPDPNYQARVTDAAQKIDLARQIQGKPPGSILSDSSPSFKVLGPGETPPSGLLPEDISAVLDGDWSDE
jgi:hypothetical protein